MKRLLLPLLAVLSASFGTDADYIRSLDNVGSFTYGSGVGSSGILCTAVTTKKIKKRDAELISSDLLNRISWPEYHRGWNDGLRAGCEFLRY